MGVYIPIHGGPGSLAPAPGSRRRRVCAWCGAAEPASEACRADTTHGLCQRCLEQRMPRGEDPAGSEDPSPSSERSDGTCE